jgi:hypothetical protein
MERVASGVPRSDVLSYVGVGKGPCPLLSLSPSLRGSKIRDTRLRNPATGRRPQLVDRAPRSVPAFFR